MMLLIRRHACRYFAAADYGVRSPRHYAAPSRLLAFIDATIFSLLLISIRYTPVIFIVAKDSRDAGHHAALTPYFFACHTCFAARLRFSPPLAPCRYATLFTSLIRDFLRYADAYFSLLMPRLIFDAAETYCHVTITIVAPARRVMAYVSALACAAAVKMLAMLRASAYIFFHVF